MRAIIDLTLREMEVLKLIEEGLSTADIARQLSLSINTIETHRKKIYKKLGVGKVVEAIKVAKNQGLI